MQGDAVGVENAEVMKQWTVERSDDEYARPVFPECGAVPGGAGA